MLIKKIMDTIEANSNEYIYSDSFIIYKNTFKKYSDVHFFNFAIKYNISMPDNEKEKMEKLYVKSKNIINIFNKFSKKMKLSLYKKYDNDRDLRFTPLDNYKEKEIINIIQNKTIYKFRILDLIYLWKIALFKSENMFSIPKKLKNPYTNIVFKDYNLYNIFFSFNKTTYVIPEIILSFFKCSFNMVFFKKKNYPILQENAIEYYGKNAFYTYLIEYLLTILHFFRKDIGYIFLKKELTQFKKQRIIKNMNHIIVLYLKYKFLCNPLLKDKYFKEIKDKLILYFKNYYSTSYFITLKYREQVLYETPSTFGNSTPQDSIIDISNNTIDEQNIDTGNTQNIRLLLDDDSDEDLVHPTRESRPFTYRRNNRRRQTTYLPPIGTTVDDSFNEFIQSLNDSNINSSISSILNSTSSSIFAESENTIIADPFQPERELPRTPRSIRNTPARNNNSIINRFTLF
jgi:hypothetical protein